MARGLLQQRGGVTPVALRWADHLPALEEWLRRMRAVLEGAGAADAPLPELTSVPDGPLPDALRLRAESALQALQVLEETGRRRRAGLARGQTYSRW